MPKVIDKCTYRPIHNVALERALLPFSTALEKCLLFAPDETPNRLRKEYYELNFDDLHQSLIKEFYERLYIPREEDHSIPEKLLRLMQMTILEGMAGSGKTTILKKIMLDNPFKPSHLVRYIDLHAKFSEIVGMGEARTGRTTCAVLYDDIYLDLMKGINDTDPIIKAEKHRRQDCYLVFRLQKHPLLTKIFIKEDEKYGLDLDDVDAWIPIVRNEALVEEIHSTLATNEESDKASLETLLRFFQEKENRQVIVILDNIDRYKLEVQAQIVEKALDLARGNTPPMVSLIAIRHMNFRCLVSEAVDDQLVQFVNIGRVKRYFAESDDRIIELHRNIDGVDEEDDKTDQEFPSPDDMPGVQEEVQTTPDFVDKLFKNRLDYLVDRAGDKIIIDADEQPTDSLRSAVEFRERLLGILAALGNTSTSGKMFQDFKDINNNSLRLSAVQLLHFLLELIRGEFQKGIGTLFDLQLHDINPTSLRTLVYRHIILESLDRKNPPAPHFQLYDLHTCGSTNTVVFLDHKILNYLYLVSGHRVHYGTMCDHFARIGVGKTILFKSLDRLREVDTRETRGLIYIDRKPERITKDQAEMSDKTLIELLPAGMFVCRRLCTSCEYLFWAALNAEFATTPWKSLFAPAHDQQEFGEKEIKDAGFRVTVATNFLVDQLLPAFENEINSLCRVPKSFSTDMTLDDYTCMFITCERSTVPLSDSFIMRARNAIYKFYTHKQTGQGIEKRIKEHTAGKLLYVKNRIRSLEAKYISES